MLEVLNDDYVRTARAKGLAERRVVLHHALRNAAIPVLTVLGLQIGHLLAGSVIVEGVFARVSELRAERGDSVTTPFLPGFAVPLVELFAPPS